MSPFPDNVPTSHQGQEAPHKFFIKTGMSGFWLPKSTNPPDKKNPDMCSSLGKVLFSSDKESY